LIDAICGSSASSENLRDEVAMRVGPDRENNQEF